MSITGVTYTLSNGIWTLQVDATPNVDSFGFNLAACRTTLILSGCGSGSGSGLGDGGVITFHYPTDPVGRPNLSWFSQSRITAQTGGCNPTGIPFTLGGTTGGIVDGAVNFPLLARGRMVYTPKNTPVSITLTARNPDVGGLCTPFTFAVVANPTHGALSGVAPNLTFTPTSGFTGADSLTFRATGCGVDSTTETIAILVGGPTPPCGF